MADDPHVGLLNRSYARKSKELKEIEKVKNVEVGEERMDKLLVDDLLSFINGGDGDSKCVRILKIKRRTVNRKIKQETPHQTMKLRTIGTALKEEIDSSFGEVWKIRFGGDKLCKISYARVT
ncbi:hypothetical protein POM88_000634 [Heracleum sosnowskyi]|uniref:Uncharacterized protein n=1 Tax=Heracleum sosnowskyi TaxID=360622 RepID=A0AAD8N8X1_9APIA|nr:hypothetical protein POM88_000634 [Heracleum sosnowskyi]